MRHGLGTGLVCLAILGVTGSDAAAQRIFYTGQVWLETSSAVQRLSLQGVLTGWQRMAADTVEVALRAPPPTRRQREALRLADCLAPAGRGAVDDVQAHVTAFAGADPDRIFYSLSDFVTEALQARCPPR